MTNTFTKITIVLALLAISFGVFSYFASSNVFLNEAEAVEGGAGGCGGCGGGGGESSGAGERGWDDIFTPVVVVETKTECKVTASASSVDYGGSVTITWETEGFTNIKLNGESVSDKSGSATFTDLTVNTRYTLTANNNSGSSCNTSVDVSCELPPVVPMCESFDAAPTTITKGDSSTLTWKTTNATRVVIDNGVGEVDLNGSTPVSPLVTKTYKLTVFGEDGQKDHCEAKVIVEEPVETECKLTLHKSVDKNTAQLGDNLTYTISIENTGTADCTGGGVRIFDVVDANLQYQNHTISSNLSAGYGGSAVYTAGNRTLKFNGHTLTPGETGEIKWTGTVTAPSACGDFKVTNQAKATARELNNFKTWSYSETVKTNVDNSCEVPVASCDDFYADPTKITKGDSSILTWKTTNATRVTIDTLGEVTDLSGSTSVSPLKTTDYKLTAFGTDGQKDECYTKVTVEPKVVTDPGKAKVVAHKVVCTDESQLPNWGAGGPNVAANTAANWVANHDSCSLEAGWEFEWTANKSNDPADDFIGKAGGPWKSFGPTNVNGRTQVTIDLESVDSSRLWFREVLQSGFIPFTHGLNNQTNVDDVSAEFYCHNDVINYDNRDFIANLKKDKTYHCVAFNAPVVEVVPPSCEDNVTFTAQPSALPVGGGDVTLDWVVVGATSVSINKDIGVVDLVGNKSIPVTESTNFVLEAAFTGFAPISCVAPVAVADPEPVFTCKENVEFTASDTSIKRGDDSKLEWNVVGADSVSISNISATSLTGSETVSPQSDTKYVLTATKSGFDDIICEVKIDVSSGGGGGGSSSPRCELEISDTKISRGDEITLTWDSTRAREITITDDKGNIIVTTEDKLSDDKKDYFDGEIDLKPTRDTEYTLVVERGSKDRTCKVDVEIDDKVVLLQTRDQAPLVAGISLSEVPYTGFEAGLVMTFLFYALLVAWALYVTYVLVIPKAGLVAKPALVTPKTTNEMMAASEQIRPDVFAAMPTKSVAASAATAVAPTNLPTAQAEVASAAPVETVVDTTSIATLVENEAHLHQALLSSGAVQSFIVMTTDADRSEKLAKVIADAKTSYPLEDGWVVINQTRLTELTAQPATTATAVTGNGSLAEAIVTGNVVAAYELIGDRPMFALADASADLDTLYRNRKGADESVSDLLTSATTAMTDQQIADMIAALTGALDGTYTNEASAVKMAIMKAVKIAA